MSSDPRESLAGDLGDEAYRRFVEIRDRIADKGTGYLEVVLASLPRKVGREPLTGGMVTFEGLLDLRALRRCDLAAAELLRSETVDGELLLRLYFQGDAEERLMILRALSFRPVSPTTIRLLQEAHRTNDEAIFKAGFADSDLPARALEDDDFNRGVLKCAFIDVDVDRLHGATSRANAPLSAMLLDFMSEREAAGRPVWAGSLVLAAHAPVPGVAPRIAGDLWSGSDARRLAAARGAEVLADPSLAPTLADRLERERHPGIKKALGRAAAATA